MARPFVEITVRPRRDVVVRVEPDQTIELQWDRLTVLLTPAEARTLVARVLDVELTVEKVPA